MRNMMMCLLVAMLSAQSIWAEIDDSNIVWTDIEEFLLDSKNKEDYDKNNDGVVEAQWYRPLGAVSAPYVGAFKNGTIISSDNLWRAEQYQPSYTLHVGEGATHILKHLWSGNGSVAAEVCVHDGGRFELSGAISYFGVEALRMKIHPGGVLIYGSTRVPNLDEIDQTDNWFDIFGRAEFPYGIRMSLNVKKSFVFLSTCRFECFVWWRCGLQRGADR